MKRSIIITGALFFLSAVAFGQGPASGMVARKFTKTDKFDFGAGGTVAINGAPTGSIKLSKADTNEIEINAEIELHAATQADLDKLQSVSGFATNETPGRVDIISYGTYNKLGDKKQWKKFPKQLFGLPFAINYEIRVPKYCDLEINGGKGDLLVKGIQGSMQINYLETNADIDILVGSLSATIASGKVNVTLGANGWTGRPATVALGTGDLTVSLPSNASAEIDASILRTGKIENTIVDLKQRDRKVPFTEKGIMAKVGVGGASLKFTVGDGNLRLERFPGKH